MNINRSNPDQIRKIIQEVLLDESKAIQKMAETLSDTAVDMVQSLLRCQGRVIVTGMGKMRAVARKTAATLSSVGTPAIFLHPGKLYMVIWESYPRTTCYWHYPTAEKPKKSST